jgi:hypothetical protein
MLEGAQGGNGAQEPKLGTVVPADRPAKSRDGNVVMTGIGHNPLLVLKREQKGRVAMFLSDQVWLWARGYEGGGPYLDLLRRLVHWLMKEPDLEEEALRSPCAGRTLTVERRTIGTAPGDVDLTLPGGEALKLTLSEAEPGLWRATLHRAPRRALQGAERYAGGLCQCRPGQSARVHGCRLDHRAARTHRQRNRRLGAPARSGGRLALPRLVDIRSGTRFGGSDFIGLRPTEASVVRGVSVMALASGGLGLLLLLVPLIGMWLREGRSRKASGRSAAAHRTRCAARAASSRRWPRATTAPDRPDRA